MSLLKALRVTTYTHVLGVQSILRFSFNSLKWFVTNNFGYESERMMASFTDTELPEETHQCEKKGRVFMIVGLGNFPQPETRHSVGLRAVDRLASRLGCSWKKLNGKHGGLLCKGVVDFGVSGKEEEEEDLMEVFLFKPKSLMNILGGNVASTAKLCGVRADSIYLVHDELDMGLGKASIKNGGSANGHRGVLSCVSALKSSALWCEHSSSDNMILPRLRIGIGRPSSKTHIVPYVLDPFPAAEVKVIESAIEKGLDLLLTHMEARIALQTPTLRGEKPGETG